MAKWDGVAKTPPPIRKRSNVSVSIPTDLLRALRLAAGDHRGALSRFVEELLDNEHELHDAAWLRLGDTRDQLVLPLGYDG